MKRKYLWPCTAEIESMMMNGKTRKLTVSFDGDANDGNLRANAIKALQKRMRKPWLWYGVNYNQKTVWYTRRRIRS